MYRYYDRQWVDEKVMKNQLSLCIKLTFQMAFATFLFKFFYHLHLSFEQVFLLCDKMPVFSIFFKYNRLYSAVFILLFNNSCFSATGGALIRCFFLCFFTGEVCSFVGASFFFLPLIFRCVIKFVLPLNSFYSCCYCFSNRIGVFHCSKLQQLYRFGVCFHLVLCECDTM